MNNHRARLTRRAALLAAAGFVLRPAGLWAAENPVALVHRDPTCSCCLGWVRHLQQAGFRTEVVEARDLDALKTRLGVPDDLAACHTAEIAGYVVEGHVPAMALKTFLDEKPQATGLAVPGMPIGSPGMEGGTPQRYEVVQFGPNGRRTYMRFRGDQPV